MKEVRKNRSQEVKQETNKPSPLVGERNCGRTEQSESGLRADLAFCCGATLAKLCEPGAISREGRVRGNCGLPRPHFVRPRNDETTCHPELVSGSSYNEIPKPLQEDPFCTKSVDFGKRRQVQNDMARSNQTAVWDDIEGRHCERSAAIQKKQAPTLTLPQKGGDKNSFPNEGRSEWVPINNVNSLTSCLPDIWTSKKKVAFTLAEVLITLGIIGVVAAMTLPTLIQKHQERVTVNKVKKFYSVMSQVQLLAIKDHGYLDEWDVPDGRTKESAEKFMSYLKPYLKIAKDCGTSSGCLQNGTIKLLNGNSWVNYDSDNRYYKLILNDGTYMWLRSANGEYCANPDRNKESCGTVWIDVNGKNPPNTIGRDIFNFGFNKNNVRTLGNNGDCSLNGAGWSCTEYVLQGNMDYLKK